jgi:uncharacterized protein
MREYAVQEQPLLSDEPSVTEATLPADAPPGFHLLAKPTGSTRTIDCTYCLFLSKEALDPTPRSTSRASP